MQMEFANLNETRLDKTALFTHLWGAADILRGSVDSADFKNYILGLLFYKRLSDVYDEEVEALRVKLGDQPNFTDLAYLPNLHRFQIPAGYFWRDIREKSTDIGAWLDRGFNEITRANDQRLHGIFERLTFNDKEVLPDSKLQKLMDHFSRYNLGNKSVSNDLLGDAYLYLIGKFASGAGKKGGEFFTPPMIVKLLIELLDPHEGASVYDPTCGSGSILLESALHVRQQGGNVRNLFLRGQEINVTTYAIARMNMILHDLDADIRREDSLRHPLFLNPNGSLTTFDYAAANPPFSLDEWGHDELKDSQDNYKRFSYGTPPRSTGDWAFVQHIVASLKPKGRGAVVMSNGILFRGGAEKRIRQGLIEADFIEAVVGLPNKLFFGTGIPGCILVVNKNKPETHKGKILFIHGANDYLPGKNQNSLRPEDVAKIANAYRQFESVPKYATVANAAQLAANDYNLNVTRYVDTAEATQPGDIPATLAKLRQLEAERTVVEGRLQNYLKELGYIE